MKLLYTTIGLLFSTLVFSQEAGSLDDSFGTEGKVLTSITNNEDKAYGVALQEDNKIVVAGYATSSVTGKDLCLVRYTTEGLLDETFGNEGIVTVDVQLGSEDIAYDLAIQADGMIVVAGSSDDGSNQNAFLTRFDTEGILDENFGVNGIVLTDFDDGQADEIRVVKIHALTGNILVGGSSVISSSLAKPVVARYLANGELDTSFDDNGIRLMWINNNDDQYVFSVEDLAVLPNGKITAAGWRDFPGLSWDSDYFTARINSDGSMDDTFAGNGVNTYNGGFNGHDRAYAMHLNADNSFFICGGGYISTLEYDFSFFEINSDGTAGENAAAVDWGTFMDDRAYGLAKDVNGAFVMAGSTGSSPNKAFAIARLNSEYNLDASFSEDGKVTTSFATNSLNEAFDVLVQSDNRIVVVGYSGEDFALARYLGDDEVQLDGFELQVPLNNATLVSYASILFNWTDAFGAASYELDLDVNSDFSTIDTYTTTNSQLNVADLLPNEEYFWRVRASDGEAFGEYSESWSFTTNTLENFNLLSPSNGANEQVFVELDLDWSSALGALSYEVEIDVDVDFNDTPTVFAASTSEYTVNSLLSETTYYWRVRASNDDTNFGEWSEVWSFTTESDMFINENGGASQIQMFPNPSSGITQLSVSAAFVGSNYSVVSITGQVVATGKITQEQMKLNFNFEPGYYVLSLDGEEGQNVGFVIQN